MKNVLDWFEIYVDDIQRARAFYEGVFQVELIQLMVDVEMYTFPMSDDGSTVSGSLIKAEGMSPGGTGTMVYFACEDCAVEAGRAAEFGGKVEREKMSIGEFGFVAIMRDTEGNMIGLHSSQ